MHQSSATLLKVSGCLASVVDVAVDDTIGGSVIDEAIVQHLIKEYQKYPLASSLSLLSLSLSLSLLTILTSF